APPPNPHPSWRAVFHHLIRLHDGGRPMQFILIVVTVAVAMLLDLRVSQATQMPWCAVTSKSDFYNCSLPTYEMCVQEVIAGNRGFCSPNPYYRGPEVAPSRVKRKR